MLVITRKKGESLFIGENVEIKVISLNDGTVKLSIDAPRDVSILRSELIKEVKEENKNASNIQEISILKDLKDLKR